MPRKSWWDGPSPGNQATPESGPLCAYCADEQGRLHPFEETFERFIQFARARIEART
ncbi:MAG: hypothetical protein OEU54_00785 [Gemmatimonadota bacterium]|nr:hypothetical protein [Gemmatimonadota bacterium]